MDSSTPTFQADAAVIEERLEAVRERVARACARAGRSVDDVTLVAVTKTFPDEVVRAAYDLGLRDFGENRVQELVGKAERLDLPGIRWHLIGHLQRNKARQAVEVMDLFHALDSRRLARALNDRTGEEGRVMPCLVQVNVSGEDSKYGLAPDALGPFLDAVRAYENLRLTGLMTLAAPTPDPEAVRPQLRRLRTLLEAHRDRAGGPPMDRLSMGMSGDYEVAVEEGATHIRLGTALFGDRT